MLIRGSGPVEWSLGVHTAEGGNSSLSVHKRCTVTLNTRVERSDNYSPPVFRQITPPLRSDWINPTSSPWPRFNARARVLAQCL